MVLKADNYVIMWMQVLQGQWADSRAWQEQQLVINLCHYFVTCGNASETTAGDISNFSVPMTVVIMYLVVCSTTNVCAHLKHYKNDCGFVIL